MKDFRLVVYITKENNNLLRESFSFGNVNYDGEFWKNIRP